MAISNGKTTLSLYYNGPLTILSNELEDSGNLIQYGLLPFLGFKESYLSLMAAIAVWFEPSSYIKAKYCLRIYPVLSDIGFSEFCHCYTKSPVGKQNP